MGFINKTVGSLFGGGQTKTVVQQAPKTEPQGKSAEEIAADDEAKKRAALIAANAGGQQPKQPLATGNANVTRKVLLGL
jgi:hypothetical protein